MDKKQGEQLKRGVVGNTMTISRLPWRKCKRCHESIWRKDAYYAQRKGKVICDKCSVLNKIKKLHDGAVKWIKGNFL